MAFARLAVQRGVRAGDVPVRDDLGEPAQAELLGLGLAHHHDAAAPSEIGDEVPAVIVPSFRNAGRSVPSVSAVVSGRMPSSVSMIVSVPRRPP
jgi:hypothetical protein